MVTVARNITPEVEWRTGDASDLPFEDESFDAVVCQAALMSFPDRSAALREMRRVTRPGGTLAVQVWASLADQPAYGPFVDMCARHAGSDAVELLSSYWAAGDMEKLHAAFGEAGLTVTGTTTHTGTARFDSIDELVRLKVESTPLIDRIDRSVYDAIRTDANEVLAATNTGSGIEVPIVGHIVTAAG